MSYNLLSREYSTFESDFGGNRLYLYHKIFENQVKEIYVGTSLARLYNRMIINFFHHLKSKSFLNNQQVSSIFSKIITYKLWTPQCTEVHYGIDFIDGDVTFYAYFQTIHDWNNFAEHIGIPYRVNYTSELICRYLFKIKILQEKYSISCVFTSINNVDIQEMIGVISHLTGDNNFHFMYASLIDKIDANVTNLEFSFNFDLNTIENIVVFTVPRFGRFFG